MPRKEHHVVHNPNGDWDVKRQHAQRSSGHFDIKKDAMEAGRRISTNHGTELIPQRKDGTIQNPDSHANDPYLRAADVSWKADVDSDFEERE